VPQNHFHAVRLALVLLVVIEVLDMVFVLPESVSHYVAKQFEIFCLILVRRSFKELTVYEGTVGFIQDFRPLLHIASEAGGALLVFGALAVFFKLQRRKQPQDCGERLSDFITIKKSLALLLLLVFAGLGAARIAIFAAGGEMLKFFELFYTYLIFVDVLIIILSHAYFPVFHAVFRNSGYALAVLLIRLALSAPYYLDALIGVGSAVFLVGLTIAYNAYFRIGFGQCTLPGPRSSDRD